jgi:hypothetical protein
MLLASQILFYSSAVFSITRFRWGLITRITDAAHAFVLLNLAAFVAFFVFVTGRKVEWGGSKVEGSKHRTQDLFCQPSSGVIHGSVTR